MKIALPIDLPSLVPTDWDKWWDIWNTHAQPLKKTTFNHNGQPGLHTGFDVFKVDNVKPTYEAVKIDLKQLMPELYDQVMSVPINPWLARFVMSNGDFPPHTDHAAHSWQLRSMFYHPDPDPQWYYTRLNRTDKRYMFLPQRTNWFAYLDGAARHGTHYVESKPKIILQIFANPIAIKKLVEKSEGLFPQYEITYD